MMYRKKISIIYNPYIQVAAISAIFLIYVCIQIGKNALWLDEAESWLWSSFHVFDLPSLTGDSNHVPAYYVTLGIWRNLGGDSEAWIRALSALFMTSTIPLVYILGRIINSHKTGLFSAIVFASLPFIFDFAREARPYAMLTFFCGVSIVCLAIIIKTYKNNTLLNIYNYKINVLWCVFIVCTFIATATHLSALLVPFILVGTYFGATLIFIRNHIRYHAVCSAVVSLILGSMWYVLIAPMFFNSVQTFEQAAVTPHRAIWELIVVYGHVHFPIIWCVFLSAALCGSFWYWKKKDILWGFYLFSIVVGMFALVVLIGVLHDSVYRYRIFIWTLVPYSVIIGFGFSQLWKSYIILIVFVMFNFVSIFAMYQDYNEPWDEIDTLLKEEYREGDAIVICPWMYHKALAYHDPPSDDLYGYWDKHVKKSTNDKTNMTSLYYRPEYNKKDIDYIPTDNIVDKYNRIWIVRRGYSECHKHFGTLSNETKFFHGKKWLSGNFNEFIVLALYEE